MKFNVPKMTISYCVEDSAGCVCGFDVRHPARVDGDAARVPCVTVAKVPSLAGGLEILREKVLEVWAMTQWRATFGAQSEQPSSRALKAGGALARQK
jgi:hypothetical protein